MSVTVEVNYEQIAVHCDSICEVASKQLKEMDRMLTELENSSTRLQNDQTSLLREEIIKEKESLTEQIRLVKSKADEEAKQGTVRVNNHEERFHHQNDAIDAANALQIQCDLLAANKLVEMRALVESILSDRIENLEQKRREKMNGTISLDETVSAILNSISDALLRQFTFIAYLQNPLLGKDELISAGKSLMSTSVEDRMAVETERIRKELEASRVSAETIDKIMTPGTDLHTVQKAATAEIVGEKIRQKSLKIIMKAVADRGFIVDKKNIRINRETNEVVMVAVKASGEKAEFRVFLDGKFIYDFHNGYKGQACQKDSKPFMQALEEVYGMHIKETREIWSNPDKISTMKYQTMGTNKNRG